MALLIQHSAATWVPLLFQAFVAPAIFVSASALLLLSLNTRLMGMVTRLRQYLHEKHLALKEGRFEQAGAYSSQIASIEKRAEMIQRSFMLTLFSLAGTISACLLLGTGLYFPDAELFAALVFTVSILALLFGSVYYLREVGLALTSVRDEAADSRFMDLVANAKRPSQEPVLRT